MVRRSQSPLPLRSHSREFASATHRANPTTASADAGLDQRYKLVDRRRRDHTRAGIQGNTWHQVLLRQHALQHWYETLQVEQLVEGDRHVAGFEAVNGCWREVDAADDNVARLLAGLLEHFRKDAGDAAMLGADCLEIGILLH